MTFGGNEKSTDDPTDEDFILKGPSKNLLGSEVIEAADFNNLKVIGRGAFAKVLLVTKKSDGKPYAMKILKKNELYEKNLVDKTQAER